jgi:hypothetical protein
MHTAALRIARASSVVGTLALVTAFASTGCSKLSSMAGGDGGSILTAAAAAVFGGDFEGVLTMQASRMHGPQQTITFQVKPGKIRIDPPIQGAQQMHVIFDAASKKMDAVMDTQKMVMEMDMSSLPASANAAAKADPMTVTKTGKHETIAGYDCEHWDAKAASGKHTDVCVAQGIRFIDFAAMSPGGSGLGSWTADLEAANSFPLSVVEYDAKNAEIARMTVTNVEKKALADALFTIPSDYKKMDMTQMLQGGLPSGMPGMQHGGFQAPPHGMPIPPHH